MKSSISFLVLFYLLYTDCSERSKSNPFDPEGDAPSPVTLSIEPSGRMAKLSWKIKNIDDFKGFRIYRAVDDSVNFSLYKEFPPEITFYTDTLEFYHWYYYKISVQGFKAESMPSKTVELYPGPGFVWILSQYGYSLQKYSYDLNHLLDLYNTQFPPASWGWNLQDNQVWLAYAQYHYISRLNISSKFEEIFYNQNFAHPIDIKWDGKKNRAVILDRDNEKIFMFNNNSILDSISSANAHFFKLALTDDSDVTVIGPFNAALYHSEDDSCINFPFSIGYSGQDILFKEGTIYILAASDDENNSMIFKYNCASGYQESMDIEGYFNLLRLSPNNDYLWLVETIDSNNSRCVKLSIEGQRLLEISLSNVIYDLQINPIDHSIIVVQNTNKMDKIFLFDSEGHKLSENTQIYDPIRVSIQE